MSFQYDVASGCYRHPSGEAVRADLLREQAARACASVIADADLANPDGLARTSREASSALFAASLLGGGPRSKIIPSQEVTFDRPEQTGLMAPSALALFDRALLSASVTAGAVRRKAMGIVSDPTFPSGWQPVGSYAIPDEPCVFDVSLFPTAPPPVIDVSGADPDMRSDFPADSVSAAAAAFGIGSRRAIELLTAAVAIGQIASKPQLAEVLLMARVLRDRIIQDPLREGEAVSEAIGYGSLESLRNASLTSTGDDVGRKRAVLAGCAEDPAPAPALAEIDLPKSTFADDRSVLLWADRNGIACPKLDQIPSGWRITQRLPAYHKGGWSELTLEDGVVAKFALFPVDFEEWPEPIWERAARFAGGGEADRAWKKSQAGRHGTGGRSEDRVDAGDLGDWQSGGTSLVEGSRWITTSQGKHILVKDGTGDQKGELVVLSGQYSGMTMSQASEERKKDLAKLEHAREFEKAKKELAGILHGKSKTGMARTKDADVAAYMLDKDGWLSATENRLKHMADVDEYVNNQLLDPHDSDAVRVAKEGERADKLSKVLAARPADLLGKGKNKGPFKVTREDMEKLRERHRKWEGALLNPEKLEPDMRADMVAAQKAAKREAELRAGPLYKRAVAKIARWAWNVPGVAWAAQKADETILGGKSGVAGGAVGGTLGALINMPIKAATGFSIPMAGVVVDQGLRAIGKYVPGCSGVTTAMNWLDKKSEQIDAWTDKTFGKAGGRAIRIGAFAIGTLAPFAVAGIAGAGAATTLGVPGLGLAATAGMAILGKGLWKMKGKVKDGIGKAINKYRERAERIHKAREEREASRQEGDPSPAFSAADEDDLLSAFSDDPTAGWGEHDEPLTAAQVKELGWTQKEYEDNVRKLAAKYSEAMTELYRKFGRDFCIADGIMTQKGKVEEDVKFSMGWCRFEPPVDPATLGPLVEFSGWPCTKGGVGDEFEDAGCDDRSAAVAYFSSEEKFRLDRFSDGFVQLNGMLCLAEGGKIVEGHEMLLRGLHAEKLALFCRPVEGASPLEDSSVGFSAVDLSERFSALAPARRDFHDAARPSLERLRQGGASAPLHASAMRAATLLRAAAGHLASRYGPAVGHAVYGLYDPRATFAAPPAIGRSEQEMTLACAIPMLVAANGAGGAGGMVEGLFSDAREICKAHFSQEGATLSTGEIEELAHAAREGAFAAFAAEFFDKPLPRLSQDDLEAIRKLRSLVPADLGTGPRPLPGRPEQTPEDRDRDLARLSEDAMEAASHALVRGDGAPLSGAWGEAIARARRSASILSDCYGPSQARAIFAAAVSAHAAHPSLAIPALARTYLDAWSWPADAADFSADLPTSFLREMGDRLAAYSIASWSGFSCEDPELSALLDGPTARENAPRPDPEIDPPSSQSLHSVLGSSRERVYFAERRAVHERLCEDLLASRTASQGEKVALVRVGTPDDWERARGFVPVDPDLVAERLARGGASDCTAAFLAEAHDVAYGPLIGSAMARGLPLEVRVPTSWSRARFCDLAERLAKAGYETSVEAFHHPEADGAEEALFSALSEHPDFARVDVYDWAYFDDGDEEDDGAFFEGGKGDDKKDGWEPSPRNPAKLRKRNAAGTRWLYKNAPVSARDKDADPDSIDLDRPHLGHPAARKAIDAKDRRLAATGANSVSKGSVDAMRRAADHASKANSVKAADEAHDKHLKELSDRQKVALAKHLGLHGLLKAGQGSAGKKAEEALRTHLKGHQRGEEHSVPAAPTRAGGGKSKSKSEESKKAPKPAEKSASSDDDDDEDKKYARLKEAVKGHADRFSEAKKKAASAKDEDEVNKIHEEFHKGMSDEHNVKLSHHLGEAPEKWGGKDKVAEKGAKVVTHRLLVEAHQEGAKQAEKKKDEPVKEKEEQKKDDGHVTEATKKVIDAHEKAKGVRDDDKGHKEVDEHVKGLHEHLSKMSHDQVKEVAKKAHAHAEEHNKGVLARASKHKFYDKKRDGHMHGTVGGAETKEGLIKNITGSVHATLKGRRGIL